MRNIYSDRRWPAGSGIGVVMREYEARWPPDLALKDLAVRGRIGSPLSPLLISTGLLKAKARRGVFWSAGFVPPLVSAVPAVVTVHDLIHLRFYSAMHRHYYKQIYLPLFKRCAHIVCVSHYTRHEFLEWSGMDAAKVSVIHNGAPNLIHADAAPAPVSQPYVFYAGNHREYKNLARVVRAFAASRLPREGFKLVLTGQDNAALRQLAISLGASEQLHFTGFLQEAELQRHYREARCVVFLSLYEGFGLPILEGMSANVPVITSNCTSMPEVAGDAALLVDPYSIEEISAAMEKVCSDDSLAQRLKNAGRARVAAFSWQASSAKLFDLLRTLE